jgi:hypothetical protein
LLIQNSVTVMMGKRPAMQGMPLGLPLTEGLRFRASSSCSPRGRFLSPEASFKQENAWAAARVKSHFIATPPGRGFELS